MRLPATIALTILLLVTPACGSDESGDDGFVSLDPAVVGVDAVIEEHMREAGIPSMAAALVAGDELLWARGYGDQPEPDTVFMIGSIAKPFVATAVLQLAEQGLVDLEADVSGYLPFTVRHPDHPDAPVTVEMLLAHRSGLAHDLPAALWWDNDETMLEWMADHADLDLSDDPFADGRASLREYLEYYVSSDAVETEGVWAAPPDTGYHYSNTGFTLLLAYLVEEVSGLDLPTYVRRNIIEPLGMTDTGYDAADFRPEQLAAPHRRHDGENRELPVTGVSASGPLRTSATDLATFLMAHINEGSVGDVSVLQPESVERMRHRTSVLSGQTFPAHELSGAGYGWTLYEPNTWGHSGGTPGFFSEMVMRETVVGPVGVVLMTNVGCSLGCDQHVFDSHFAPIREMLLDEAEAELVVGVS